MILEFIFIASTFQTQTKTQTKTVAITTDPNKPAIIMQHSEAENLYKELLKYNKDPKLFAALTVALGKIPDAVHCTLYNNCIAVDQIRHHCKLKE